MKNNEVKELVKEITTFVNNGILLFDKLTKEEIVEIHKAILNLDNYLYNFEEYKKEKEQEEKSTNIQEL